jgi:hypothetical protein
VIVTQGLDASTAIDVNVGYTLVERQDGGGHDGLLHYGAAVRRELHAGLWIVGEAFAVTAVEGGLTSVGLNVGVQREVAPDLVLDAAVGTGLRNGPDLTATVGLTWVF